MSHGQCACLVHEQCIASQNFLQASAAHRCDRLSISAIPLPHAACTAAGPRIAAWCTAMHRGGVHLLAECHQPSLVNGARKAGSAAATCMIRHTFSGGTRAAERLTPSLHLSEPPKMALFLNLVPIHDEFLFLVHRIQYLLHRALST